MDRIDPDVIVVGIVLRVGVVVLVGLLSQVHLDDRPRGRVDRGCCRPRSRMAFRNAAALAPSGDLDHCDIFLAFRVGRQAVELEVGRGQVCLWADPGGAGLATRSRLWI